MGPELQRVHKDSDGRDVALGGRPPDQRCVALVQVAHGRHEPHGPTRHARRVELLAEAVDAIDHLHQRASTRSSTKRRANDTIAS